MAVEYVAETKTLLLTKYGAEPLALPVLVLNRCTCGAILRVYVDLPANRGLNLEDYLPSLDASRFETKRLGRYLLLFPNPYSTARCCPREKHLAFALEPVVAAWLKKQRIEPEPKVVDQVVSVLTTQQVPGFGLIRDEITGDPIGFTWLQRAIYGGERYWSGKVCQRCFEPVYAHETVCRACGSQDLMPVETETWEQAEERRGRGWDNLWRTLGLRRPE